METTRRRRKGGFKELVGGLWSLIVGLGVTGKEFLRPGITVHYPRKTVSDTNLETYRGHIELVPKPKDLFTPRCIVCGMCVKVCPSGCITIKLKKEPEEAKPPKEAPAKAHEGQVAEPAKAAPPKKKKKTPGKVLLNYNLCSLCGLCVQSCPVNSLRHSNNVYLASLDKDDYSAMDLLQRLKEQGEKAPPPEEKPKKPKPETPEAPKPAEARAAAEDATTGPQETAGEKAVEAPGEAKADTEPDKQ